MTTYFEAAGATSYPGRGIMAGKSADGKKAIFAYFITGRSENSRNRVFVLEDSGMRTQAFDESKMKDPSLIIYWPVRKLGDSIIVTNGDQTDTVYEFVKEGKSFVDALNTRCFEPDAPNFTPRISLMADFKDNDFSFKMSVLKSNCQDGKKNLRCYYFYDQLDAGEGKFIHTYAADGNPLPSFTGEPEHISFTGEIDEITEKLWENLNADNRVSLWVETRNLVTGKTENRVINRNK